MIVKRKTGRPKTKRTKKVTSRTQKGRGLAPSRCDRRTRRILRHLPSDECMVKFYGNSFWSKLKKSAVKAAKALGSKEGRQAIKSLTALGAKHGPAKYQGKFRTANTVMNQIGMGGRIEKVMYSVPAGGKFVLRGDGFWSFIKDTAKKVGRAIKSKPVKALVKTGLDLTSQFGGPKARAGATTARATLDQLGYNYLTHGSHRFVPGVVQPVVIG